MTSEAFCARANVSFLNELRAVPPNMEVLLKPEEGCSGQRKYCFKIYLHVVDQLFSCPWTSRNFLVVYVREEPMEIKNENWGNQAFSTDN